METSMSVTAETARPSAGEKFHTEFYDIFTMHWTSPAPSKLYFSVTANTPSDPSVTLVDITAFLPSDNEKFVQGIDPVSGITFQGTITASWHTAVSGKLSGSSMLFVLSDGTPFHLDGDIGLWS